MNVIKMEAHFFCDNYDQPEKKDIPQLIDLFSDFELMPMYFEDQGRLPNFGSKKSLGFTNPETNKGVYFKSDRILVSWSVTPFEYGEGRVEDLVSNFLNFSDFAIRSCDSYAGEKFLASRLSLVSHFVHSYDDVQGSDRLQNAIVENFPWCQSPLNELNLRFGQVETLESNGEYINNITTINKGVVDINVNGQSNTTPCYMIVLDLNTTQDRKEHRFSASQAVSIWRELSERSDKKLESVKGFLED